MPQSLPKLRAEQCPFKVVRFWTKSEPTTAYYFTRGAAHSRYAAAWTDSPPWELYERQEDGSWVLIEESKQHHSIYDHLKVSETQASPTEQE